VEVDYVFRASEIVVVFQLTANPDISTRTGKSDDVLSKWVNDLRQSYRNARASAGVSELGLGITVVWQSLTFASGDGRPLSVQNARRFANILRAPDDAVRPEDMNLLGFRFHSPRHLAILICVVDILYADLAKGGWPRPR
jgi:hypothetical protein